MSTYVLHRITSLDIPGLEPYKTLRRPEDHLKQGIFVAEGEKVVRRFLASSWPLVSLLTTPERWETVLETIPEDRLTNAHIYIGEKELLETIVGFALHQGIMAVGMTPTEQPLSDFMALRSAPHRLAALDGLVHADNVGVVVRNCAAFGVDAILAGATTASPYLRRAVRNSMGGIFKVPCFHLDDLAGTLGWLRKQYTTRIIIADAKGPVSIYEADFGGNICIVLGNEGGGVSAAVDALADVRVRIPMQNNTDSLNVASASAVLLYEASKRRSEAGHFTKSKRLLS